MTPTAVETMLSQLSNRGFACVSLQHEHCPWIQDALQSATARDAASLGAFRFPPLEGPIVYTESRRLAFRALFEVATNCFSGMLHHANCSDHLSTRDDGQSSSLLQQKINIYTAALHQIHDNKEGSNDFELFRHNNEPFEHDDQPFSQSFFNLFNYNHGSLNSHVDRSLLTVIYSNVPNHEDVVEAATSISGDQPSPSNQNSSQRRSSLWIKDNKHTWHNADQAVQLNEAIVMVGEDLMSSNNDEKEESSIASILGLYAAEHAVRVDPAGLRIERSHFRKDPRCTEDIANRCSAAMILRHEATV